MIREELEALLMGVLAIIIEKGGRVNSRLRIQKIAFLLKISNLNGFRSLDFSYHHYGPYSRQLSDIIQDLVAAEIFVEEIEEFNEAKSRYSYSVTKKGENWAEQNAYEDSESIRGIIQQVGDINLRALELLATVLYLEQDQQLEDREQAFENALALKPECAPWNEEAQVVLSSLQL